VLQSNGGWLVVVLLDEDEELEEELDEELDEELEEELDEELDEELEEELDEELDEELEEELVEEEEVEELVLGTVDVFVTVVDDGFFVWSQISSTRQSVGIGAGTALAA